MLEVRDVIIVIERQYTTSLKECIDIVKGRDLEDESVVESYQRLRLEAGAAKFTVDEFVKLFNTRPYDMLNWYAISAYEVV